MVCLIFITKQHIVIARIFYSNIERFRHYKVIFPRYYNVGWNRSSWKKYFVITWFEVKNHNWFEVKSLKIFEQKILTIAAVYFFEKWNKIMVIVMLLAKQKFTLRITIKLFKSLCLTLVKSPFCLFITFLLNHNGNGFLANKCLLTK